MYNLSFVYLNCHHSRLAAELLFQVFPNCYFYFLSETLVVEGNFMQKYGLVRFSSNSLGPTRVTCFVRRDFLINILYVSSALYWARFRVDTEEAFIDFIVVHAPNAEGEYKNFINSLPTRSSQTIWIGDFNAHHPHWNHSPTTGSAIRIGESLYEYFTSNAATLLTKKDTPTHHRGGKATHTPSILDHLWVTEEVLDMDLEHHTIPSTDHVAIHATTQKPMPPGTTTNSYKWCNWDDTKTHLKEHIKLKDLNRRCIQANEEKEDPTEQYHDILEEAKEVMDTLKQAIERNTPRTKAKIKDAPWWTEIIRKQHDTATKAMNRWRRKGTERHRSTYKRHQKRRREEIRKAKLEHWIKSLEDIDTRNPWSMLRKRGEGSTVPQLINTAGQQVSEHKDKGEALIRKLFPNQPTTDATLDHNPLGFTTITEDEIGKIIRSIPTGKSLGSDGIPLRGITVLFQEYPQIIL